MIQASLSDNFLCEMCAYKPFCGLGPVCNYSQTGNLITDVTNSERCKTFKGIFDYLFKRLSEPETKKIFESWVK